MHRIWQAWLFFASTIVAQTVAPSNNSADISDPSDSARFYINATGPVEFPPFEIAPLVPYNNVSKNEFRSITFGGFLVNTDANNVNQITGQDFNLVSCDPEDYTGSNIDAVGVLRLITDRQDNVRYPIWVILYSKHSNHCNASGLEVLPQIGAILTTLDANTAQQVASRDFTEDSNAAATLSPAADAYGGTVKADPNGVFSSPPTTAIAMIILYSITGIITALFVVIIVTGAVRAHRHPERYGPRNVQGRGRQSRAKGIARAMLETLPIVKFGDHHNLPKEQTQPDIEMSPNKSSGAAGSPGDKGITTTTTTIHEEASTSRNQAPSVESVSNADGSDETGSLGCSICTEDFQKGEEVRVLPCNHKFHPECVDPWLLNVSGTCPLCRVDLRPQNEQTSQNGRSSTAANEDTDHMPPPLGETSGDRRSQAVHSLRALAYGSREERISALRRYRAERRNRSMTNTTQEAISNEEEERSLASRFRDRLRVRTRRHDGENVPEGSGETSTSEANARQGTT